MNFAKIEIKRFKIIFYICVSVIHMCIYYKYAYKYNKYNMYYQRKMFLLSDINNIFYNMAATFTK